jgi:hypothetical protein
MAEGTEPDAEQICTQVMRLREMCKCSQDIVDIMELLPLLVHTDPQEQEAARKAIVEVTNRTGGHVFRF